LPPGFAMSEVCLFLKLFRRVSANIAAARNFAGPEGQRVYAVGDIHGRLDLLDNLLAQIEDDIVARPVPTIGLVFLGDLVDRGPNSAGVIERLCTLQHFPAKALFLMGNHEEVLLRVLNGEPGLAYDWLGFGGDACAESYGVAASELQAMSEERIAEVLGAAIPPAHVAFLESFGDTFRFGDYLFVHAGIRPGVPIEEQQPKDLRWIRNPFLSDGHDHGCMVVHGHTISDGIDQRVNRIGIDTGAYRTGILTAAVIEGSELRFLATEG
jgi:serine/threonine protein phosphatase 1